MKIINYECSYEGLKKMETDHQNNTLTYDNLIKFITGPLKKEINKSYGLDHPLLSLFLSTIADSNCLTTRDVTTLLQYFVKVTLGPSVKLPRGTATEVLYDVITYYEPDYFWIDIIRLKGYKFTTAQNRLLDKIYYCATMLIVKPQAATENVIENMFNNPTIIMNILDKHDKHIIDYLKKSKCQITDQCVLNAYHISVHKLIFVTMRHACYNYLFHNSNDTIKNIFDTTAKLNQNFDLIMSFFQKMKFKFTSQLLLKLSILLFSSVIIFLEITYKLEDVLHCSIFKHMTSFFRKNNVFLNPNEICTFYDKISKFTQYLNPAHEKCLLKCIDKTKSILTDDNVKQLFECTFTNKEYDGLSTFLTLQNICKYKFSKEITEYAIITNNIKLFGLMLFQKTELHCSPQCIKAAFYHGNIDVIKYMLENKISITDDDVNQLALFKGNYNILKDIVNLLVTYNVNIPQKIKELMVYNSGIYMSNLELTDSVNERLLSIIVNANKDIIFKNVYGDNDVSNIRNLRAMFLADSVLAIKKFMLKHNLTPDIYCFENTLLEPNVDAFLYVNIEFGYVPSITAIMTCPSMRFRMGLLCRFYPDLYKFNYIEEPTVQHNLYAVLDDSDDEYNIVKYEYNMFILSDSENESETDKKPAAKYTDNEDKKPVEKKDNNYPKKKYDSEYEKPKKVEYDSDSECEKPKKVVKCKKPEGISKKND